MRNLTVVLATTLLAACSNSVSVQRDAEIVSSIQFDEVACPDLLRQRDQLAAQYGLQPTAQREPQPESATPGFGLVIPDMRSGDEKARAQASGRLSAMNNSINRRNCGQPNT